jgi:protein TonB
MNRREPPGWGPDWASTGLVESDHSRDPGQHLVVLDHPAEPGGDLVVKGQRPVASGFTTRRLIVTLLVSLGLHAAAAIAVLLLLHAGVPVADGPEKPTEVELVMEEHKGDPHPTATPTQPTPQAERPPLETPRPSKPPAPDATEQTAAPVPDETPPEQTAAETPVQPKAAAQAKTAETPVQVAHPESPPAAQQAPTVSLQGTDSPSDAKAFGANVIPAAADAVFHNRPPEYPPDSAMNGEHGIVVVVIHVSPMGTALGVDLVRSSGYVLLDRAARDAVMHWRFLPAVKDGQPVASDMAMGFDFENR